MKRIIKQVAFILSSLSIVIVSIILVWPKTKMIKTTGSFVISANNSNGEIFPNVESKDLYQYIRFSNDKPIITEELISHFIKKIIMNSSYDSGQVHVSVFKISDSNVDVSFIIKNSYKTIYSIKLV